VRSAYFESAICTHAICEQEAEKTGECVSDRGHVQTGERIRVGNVESEEWFMSGEEKEFEKRYD
jgi:hypothetical protein